MYRRSGPRQRQIVSGHDVIYKQQNIDSTFAKLRYVGIWADDMIQLLYVH